MMTLQALPSGVSAGVREALERATRFLTDAQTSDGSWRDFELEVGYSDVWVTAYAGYCLTSALGVLAQRDVAYAEPACDAAAAFLETHRAPADGLWGYNQSIVSDCDSSSWALLLLRARGRAVAGSVLEEFIRFSRDDGGFATYNVGGRRDGSDSEWLKSHPDVTPMALRALTACDGDRAVRAAALRYVGAMRGADGLWQSYWYRSPLYATLQSSIALADCGVAAPALEPGLTFELERVHDDAFELTLALEIAARFYPGRFGGMVRRGIAALLAMQLPDGRWMATVPMLRQTGDGVSEPWAVPPEDAGGMYFDEQCNFTTATVVQFLGRVLRSGAIDGRA